MGVDGRSARHVYLALAEHEDATFVTADRRLVERAAKRRLRVPVADLAAF